MSRTCAHWGFTKSWSTTWRRSSCCASSTSSITAVPRIFAIACGQSLIWWSLLVHQRHSPFFFRQLSSLWPKRPQYPHFCRCRLVSIGSPDPPYTRPPPLFVVFVTTCAFPPLLCFPDPLCAEMFVPFADCTTRAISQCRWKAAEASNQFSRVLGRGYIPKHLSRILGFSPFMYRSMSSGSPYPVRTASVL